MTDSQQKKLNKSIGNTALHNSNKDKTPSRYNITLLQCLMVCLLIFGGVCLWHSNSSITGFAVVNATLGNETLNHAPVWISNVSSFTVNLSLVINLSKYFYDEDNDSLSYSSVKVDNLTVKIDKELATIIPLPNFTGVRIVTFMANDSELSAKANVTVIIKQAGYQNITQGDITNHAPMLLTMIPNISIEKNTNKTVNLSSCLVYTSPSPRD